jgi:hypothetical protein
MRRENLPVLLCRECVKEMKSLKQDTQQLHRQGVTFPVAITKMFVRSRDQADVNLSATGQVILGRKTFSPTGSLHRKYRALCRYSVMQ